MITGIFRNSLLSAKKQTTNVCAIYQKDLFSKPVLLLSENKQNEIISFLDKNLTIIFQNKKSIEELLAQISKMHLSILKSAFEGKLVPQDPNDEPASVLLQKIRAQKHPKKR